MKPTLLASFATLALIAAPVLAAIPVAAAPAKPVTKHATHKTIVKKTTTTKTN